MWPILAGKEEEWRRFLQELAGSKSEDLMRMKSRLKVGAMQVWLQRSRCGEIAVVYMETEDAAEAISVLTDSEEPFERWFKSKIEEFHGVDVARAEPNATPELVFRLGSQ